MVLMTGFDSRANYATGLAGSDRPPEGHSNTASPSNPTILIKQNGRAIRTLPFHLVRMTGFEPTRLSTLEPDGNVTSVEASILASLLSRIQCTIKQRENQVFSWFCYDVFSS